MCSESKSTRALAETVPYGPGGDPTAQAPTGMAMSLDTCSPDLSQPSFTEPGFRPGLSQQRLARLAPRPASGLRSPVKCCADATLMRGEPIAASALHCRRFLLLEVPGRWGRSALDESRGPLRGDRLHPDQVASREGRAGSAAS
jgi:hypothetical protein